MSTPVTDNSHPKAFWFIFWGEFAERCCFYGARTIMMLYMTTQLGLTDQKAGSYFFSYKMGCYFLPLIGGYLADRFLGRYWTIVGFSIPYIIGQLLLCLPSGGSDSLDFTFLLLSLALLAGGSGVIKPNISSLLGMTYDQKRPGNLTLRFQAFQWFYFAINIGSLLSMITLPIIRDTIANHYEATLGHVAALGLAYRVAFAIPAVLMIGALLAFAAGKRYYAIENPGPAPALPPEQKREQWRIILSLLGVFALYILFWIPYEHNDSLWVLFAKDHVNRSVPWFASLGLPGELPPDWFQWINAAMVLVLIVFFQWFWPKVDPHNRISPIAKISVGFFFTACAPGILTLCAWMSQDGSKVSYWWMVLAYVILTFGEVLAYGTGLDFSFGQAPASMKSMITSCFLVTNALANLVNFAWIPTYEKQLTPFQFYGIGTLLPLFAAVAILFVGKKFRTKKEAA